MREEVPAPGRHHHYCARCTGSAAWAFGCWQVTWWVWSFSSFVFIYQGSLLERHHYFLFTSLLQNRIAALHQDTASTCRVPGRYFFLCFFMMAKHSCPWEKHQSCSRDDSTELTEKPPYVMLVQMRGFVFIPPAVQQQPRSLDMYILSIT